MLSRICEHINNFRIQKKFGCWYAGHLLGWGWILKTSDSFPLYIPSHSELWLPIKTSLDVSNRKCFKDFLSFCNDAHSVALLQQTVKGHLVFTVARHYPRSPENLHPRLVIETHVPGPGNEPMVRSTGKSWQKENPESKGRATNWKKYHLTCLNWTNIALTDVLWICKKIVSVCV